MKKYFGNISVFVLSLIFCLFLDFSVNAQGLSAPRPPSFPRFGNDEESNVGENAPGDSSLPRSEDGGDSRRGVYSSDIRQWFEENTYGYKDLIADFFRATTVIAIALSFGIIIASGYTYMTSQGNPEKVKETSERLAAAIGGILFILGAYVLLKLIENSLF